MRSVFKLGAVLALTAGSVSPAFARCDGAQLLRIPATFDPADYRVNFGPYCKAKSLKVTYGKPTHGLAGKCFPIHYLGNGADLILEEEDAFLAPPGGGQTDPILENAHGQALTQLNFRLYYNSKNCTGGPGEGGYKVYWPPRSE